MKKLLCFLLAVIMLFTLLGCEKILGSAMFLFQVATGDDSAQKNEICEFVIENEEELRRAIEDGNVSAFENQGFIKSINAGSSYIEFYCGGSGVGSGTSYVGFCYTADDEMTDIWCAPPSVEALVPCGDGFEWKETDGDNRCYIEKICENFYYYEASY